MGEVLRQTWAMGKLGVRGFLRRSYNANGVPSNDQKRAVSRLLLTTLFLGILGNNFWTMGRRVGETPGGRTCILLALALIGAAGTLLRELPGPLQRRSLGGPALDPLPIHWGARLVISFSQTIGLMFYAALGLLASAPLWRESVGAGAFVVGVSSAVCASVVLAAAGLAVALRVLLRPDRLPMLFRLLGGATALAGAALFFFGMLASSELMSASIALPLAVSLDGDSVGAVLSGLLPFVAIGLLGLAIIALAEARGYDRLEITSAKVRGRAGAGRFTLDAAERLLLRRQGGWTVVIGVSVVLLAMTVGIGSTVKQPAHRPAATHHAKPTEAELRDRIDHLEAEDDSDPSKTERLRKLRHQLEDLQGPPRAPVKSGQGDGRGSSPADPLHLLLSGMAFMILYAGGGLGLNFAARAVQRDVAARAFLSPLPIAPGETLDGKAAALRRVILPFGLAYLALVFFLPDRWPTLLWRFGALEGALFLLCEAAPAVSFLTNGLGAVGVFSVGRPLNLASVLLFLPALRATVAEGPGGAALALGALAALAFEARRAAMQCLRWLDDGGDGLTRDTAAWRALLVFGAFVAIQGFAAQLFSLGSADTPPEWALPGAYAFSGAALLLLTVTRRQGLPPLVFWPKQVWLLPLGIAAGAVTGALGLGYLQIVKALGVLPSYADEMLSPGAALGLALTAVVLAPLAEETFFRGWLQPAIKSELPPHRVRWAVVLAAAAFAVVHPAISFVPVVLLGLAAGVLYEMGGALLPGMLAHTAHNAVAVFFGQ